MGKMKFPFPNSQGIFLHDTPTREHFAKSNRAISNGCVRVEDYGRLANWAFGRNVAAEGTSPEQAIALPRGIPVYTTYLTMVPGASGMTTFEDRYGWDRHGALAGGMPVTAAAHASVAASPAAN
jgi:murein L,D-transpeptidase YcbB/YkuD